MAFSFLSPVARGTAYGGVLVYFTLISRTGTNELNFDIFFFQKVKLFLSLSNQNRFAFHLKHKNSLQQYWKFFLCQNPTKIQAY